MGRAKELSPARVFWLAWTGWMLDGMDSSLYIYVIVPALGELLAASGKRPTDGAIALAGGVMFSLFMTGWAAAMLWGVLADRWGRVRVMILTILTYSLFTALSGLAPSLGLFALCRFLAGFGVGGEWIAGTPFLHENVPERMRVRLAGWLHTATPAGLLAGTALSFLLPWVGWRGLFLLGAAPALFALLLRLLLADRPVRRLSAPIPIRTLLFGALAGRAWVAAAMMAAIILGLWSSTYWVPTMLISHFLARGLDLAAASRRASLGGLLIHAGTVLGCFFMPALVRLLRGRRRTALFFFLGAFAVDVAGYGVIAARYGRIDLFFFILPLLGFFSNGVFALYTIWLPEMFPPGARAAGAGFAFSLGRLLGAVGPSLVGAMVRALGTYPLALAAVALIYLIGLPFIALAPETASLRLGVDGGDGSA
jgi:MFS family permease